MGSRWNLDLEQVPIFDIKTYDLPRKYIEITVYAR